MSETTQFAGMEGDSRSDNSLKGNVVLLNRYKVMGVLGGGVIGSVYDEIVIEFVV